LAAADFPIDQTPVLIEGQLDLHPLEAAPLAHQCLATEINRLISGFKLGAQIIHQIYPCPDGLAAPVALDGNPIGVLIASPRRAKKLTQFIEKSHNLSAKLRQQ
jgi:hypothetical protein